MKISNCFPNFNVKLYSLNAEILYMEYKHLNDVNVFEFCSLIQVIFDQYSARYESHIANLNYIL